MPGPGTFEPKRSAIPSSGWMRSVSTFGSLAAGSPMPNSSCGAGLNWIAISDERFGQALAVPQVERHARPAPVVDQQLERDERLGRASPATTRSSSR